MENEVSERKQTFLSENVYDVLVHSRMVGCCRHSIINDSLVIDWNKVDDEFGCISECDNIVDNCWEWYRDKIKVLWSIIHLANEKFRASTTVSREILFMQCSWIFSGSEMEDLYSKFTTNGESELLFCVLELTSYLDRGLGDVYKSSCDQVPFLLKDMLASSILSDVFGNVQIKFLQLLLGTVRGLNIRNIAWHGFLSPGELHQSIISILFLVIGSLGKSLKVFNRRATIKYEVLQNYSQQLEPFLPEAIINNLNFFDIVTTCPFISVYHWNYWKYAFELYDKRCYGESLIVLMPLKENLLRSILCYANNCSERILTAESTAFYTTIDDILAPNFGSADNRLKEVIGVKILEILLDFYMYDEGLRIRDRMSHSEIKPYNVPKGIARCVFAITILLIELIKKNVKKDVPDKIIQPELYNELNEIAVKYEPQFHPLCILKRSLIIIVAKLELWNNLPKPLGLASLNEDETNKVAELFKLITGKINFSNFSSVLTQDIIDLRPATIFRPKYELELVSMLRKIISCVEVINNNIVESCKTRYILWNQRQLKSRNRENYKRMLECIDCLQYGIGCILHIIFVTLKQLQIHEEEIFKKFLRFFRICQKYTENACSMSSVKKNRWKELQDSTLNITNDIFNSCSLFQL